MAIYDTPGDDLDKTRRCSFSNVARADGRRQEGARPGRVCVLASPHVSAVCQSGHVSESARGAEPCSLAPRCVAPVLESVPARRDAPTCARDDTSSGHLRELSDRSLRTSTAIKPADWETAPLVSGCLRPAARESSPATQGRVRRRPVEEDLAVEGQGIPGLVHAPDSFREKPKGA